MRQKEKRAGGLADVNERHPKQDAAEPVHSAARKPARHGPEAALVRQLNGPLTALLIYIGEIKEHSHQFSEAGGNRAYLQQVVENALQQTERVCALVRQIASPQDGSPRPRRAAGSEAPTGHRQNGVRAAATMFASGPGQKPLTKREREVLDLISEGYSNKQGALRMGISRRRSKAIAPRRCESSARAIPRTSSARPVASGSGVTAMPNAIS